MEIDLLGRFAVRRDGRAVDAAEFGGRRVRQLVRMLAAERGRVVSRDALIEVLWGEHLPADPATNLNVVVNRARRALGVSEVIETVDGGYQLRAGSDVVVDAEEFASYVGQAREALARRDVPRARTAAKAALRLWGEPLAEDAYADWARAHRDRLERLHQDALEVAAGAALGAGDTRGAVDLAAQAVARQPLREAAHLLLIRALAADGDQAAALSAYTDLRRVLADELGVDPSPEAAALQEQLLRGTLPSRTTGGRSRPATDAPPMVGRDEELAELCRLGGETRVAVVAGRSGSGKSRLLEELVAQVDRRGLSARALLPEREVPWSLARTSLQGVLDSGVDVGALLRPVTVAALAEVLPDLVADQADVDPQTRRALIQQGAVRLLESSAPSLVVVDDLQWTDSSSLEILALLAERNVDVSMVLAYRPEEVEDGSPVARFLAELGHARPLELALDALRPEALRRLVATEDVAAALAEHTDRTPFAVLQVLRTLEREGLLRYDAAGMWHWVGDPVLDRVRDVAQTGHRDTVWRQFERQPGEARELLGLLALLGRPVPVRLLATASGAASAKVLSLLSDLARNHLVRHDSGGFRVAHDLVGETVRDRLAPIERARLHQLLAAALEDDGGSADESARHLAGAGDATAAASAYARAATERLDRFADREAQQLAGEGLLLNPSGDVRAALLEVRAETAARRGDFVAARDDVRAAFAATTARRARSRQLARLAALTAGTEDMLRAAELAELALAEAGNDVPARARALYTAALVDMNLRLPRADERYDEALSLFTALGDARGVADILDARAMTGFISGDITGAIEGFDRVAKLFTDNGNLLRVVTPRATRGHGLVFAARPEEALFETGFALDLARSLGYAEGEAMVLWTHSEALVACGRRADGLAAAESGLSIAKRVGHRGWTATGFRALGFAREALGDVPGAVAAFESSLRTSEHFPMFASRAHSGLALVLLKQGRYADAAEHVRQALEGPGIALYEARLAQCELAVARGDDDAVSLIDEALERAVTGGHHASAERLGELREGVARS